jgi:hypothetical protein
VRILKSLGAQIVEVRILKGLRARCVYKNGDRLEGRILRELEGQLGGKHASGGTVLR